MDSMTIGPGSKRSKPCSATSTVRSRYTNRGSKCPRRAKNASATRDCGTWFGLLKFAVGSSTCCRTLESLSRCSLPCNSQFDGLLQAATSLVVWSGYRDEIVSGLARNGVQESDLWSACVMLERISATTRATVWVRKKTSAVMVRISERILNESEIQRLRHESPTDYDELMCRGFVTANIQSMPEPLIKEPS